MKQSKKIILLVTLMATAMLSVPLLNAATASTYYWWDNVYFLGGAQTFKYPHPDRNYYGINIYASWSIFGNKLLHVQLDQTSSGALIGTGAGVIGTAIGAVIVALGVGITTPVGAVIAIVVGGALAAAGIYTLLDESNCMWFWISTAFLNWVAQYWYLGPAVVAAAWILYGYLRVGSLTLPGDAVGAGSPSPPSYYVSSIITYGAVGTGSSSNPANLVGSSNNGNYAQLYAGNPGDSAWVYGNMNGVASGHVYVYGYSRPGYTSHLVTSVLNYTGTNWITISDQMLQPKSSPYSIDCGSIASYFVQIKFYVDFHNGYSACVLMDAVHVVGASENIVSSIINQQHSSGGAVNNPNNLKGKNDGLYTHLHASNSGDYAWIVGNMNSPTTGHVYIFGRSTVGYTSHLVVSVSADGYTWLNIADKMINGVKPGANYFDCGSATYPFNYIKFYVDYHTGYSAALDIDAVHVLS
jgi:hypothetical protein